MKYLNYFFVLLSFLFISSQFIGQGVNCADADPFCTQTGSTFPASTNTTAQAGANYGCLGSQPNPAWYYLQIATSGNIMINLTNQSTGGSSYDIDFAIWGPLLLQRVAVYLQQLLSIVVSVLHLQKLLILIML